MSDPSKTRSALPLLLVISTISRILSVEVELTSINDFASNATNCFPVAGTSCNLRSAWDACNQMGSPCIIKVPASAELSFNTSLGYLILTDTADIEIHGYGSTITNNVEGSAGSFLRWDLPVNMAGVPSLTVRSLTFVGFQNNEETGGVMAFAGEAKIIIDSCTFTDNSALSGGAIYITDNTQGAQIVDTVFQDCSAEQGGAVSFDVNVHGASIVGSEFIRCQVASANGAYGGGLYLNYDNYDFNITSSHFTQCSADFGGGMFVGRANDALVAINNVFESCSAWENGGGVYVWSQNHNMNLIDNTFVLCTAVSYGGGLHVEEYNDYAEITGGAFQSCSGYSGGGAYFAYTNEYAKISGTAFTECSAGYEGGGVSFYSSNSYLTIDSVTFTRCGAMYGGGSAVYEYGDDSVMKNNVYTDCLATDATLPLTAAGGGAYILYANRDMLVYNNQFLRCTSTGYAGGLYIDYYSFRAVLSHNHFGNCAAGKNGGGIWSYQDEDLQILSSTFVDCAAEKGGAIFVETLSDRFTISDCSISHCTASIHGGGIYIGNNNPDGVIRGCNITDCHTDGNGGGIYLDNSNDNLLLEDSVIEFCSATYGGGFLSARNDDVSLQRTRISNCSADAAGGGLNFIDQNANIRIVRCEISDNTAASYGGGLVSEDLNSGLVLVGTHFLRNHAEEVGGGVYVGTGNPQFTVIDTDSYDGVTVIESPHPYDFTDAFEETVTVPGAAALILYFDARSRVSRQDGVFVFTNDTKTELLLKVYGAKTWPGINLPPLRVNGDSFHIELYTFGDFFTAPTETTDNVYGFKLYVTPVMRDPAEVCIFEGNTAKDNGGGLFMFSGVAFPILLNTKFTANKGHDGGGVALRNAITGMTIEACDFVGNQANSNGGGLLVVSASYGLLVLDCVFFNNHAFLGGGAISFVNNNGNDGKFLTGNENHIKSCDLRENSVTADGGAIFAALNNRFVVTDCIFSGNEAFTDGGAVAVLATNTVRMENCALQNNFAYGSGGAIGSRLANKIELATVTITANTAEHTGGAISMNASTLLTIVGDCSLTSNTAGLVGGGIALFASPQVVLSGGHLTVANNTAQRGSALYYNALVGVPDQAMQNLYIYDNVASVGGTVYWVFDRKMTREPAGLASASVFWGYNQAPYGNVSATQAVHLAAPGKFEVQSYGSFISPAPVLTLRDYYGQLMPLDGPTAIQTSIAGASADQCDGRFPYLSGTDVLAAGVEMVDGQATLKSLEASCAPLGKVTLSFAAQLNDLTELDVAEYAITNTTAISFRACRMGEVIVNGQCVVCPRGTFSLEDNVESSTICKECLNIDGVTSCFGSTIVVDKGYWRRYPTSLAVLPCMDDLSGCNGGSATGVDSCLDGYEGALCSVCKEGYYRSDKLCVACNGAKPTFSPAVIFYMCLGALAVVVVGFVAYRRLKKARAGAKTVQPGKYSVFFANLATWFTKLKKSTNVQLKILITTFQITSTIPASMEVNFPHSFSKYLSAMTVVNLNIVSVVPINCGHSGYNFIDKMVMMTLGPIVASIVILMVCSLEYAVYVSRTRPATVSEEVFEEKKSKILTKYLTYFFLLTYLVLPSVSTTIFKTFLCTDIDPLHEDENKSDLFLTADMRVSCSTDYYRRGVAYASIMIIVYVVGIPAMYLALLWRCRKAIMGRFDPPETEAEALELDDLVTAKGASIGATTDLAGSPVSAKEHSGAMTSSKKQFASASTKQKASEPTSENTVGNLAHKKDPASHMALMISFLYEAYEPEYWYWEVIETTRRLMLTAVLSICGTGTAAQAIFAVLLALMYIKLYGFYSPYNLLPDDIVAETGQFQIFLSFLGALIYQRHLLGDSWNNYISMALIFINTAVLVLFVYFSCRTLSNAIKESNGSESRVFTRGINMISLPFLRQLGGTYAPQSQSKVYAESGDVGEGGGGERIALPEQNLAYIGMRSGEVDEEHADTLIPERHYDTVADYEQIDSPHVSSLEDEHV